MSNLEWTAWDEARASSANSVETPKRTPTKDEPTEKLRLLEKQVGAIKRKLRTWT